MKAQKRLLLVDDGTQLNNCRTTLEQSGYAVITARSAREGLKLLASAPVDVVVLACARDGARNGYAAACRMRKHNPRLRILMTAEGAELPESALNVADGFIDARNRPEFFLMAVDRLLHRDRRLTAA